MSDPSFPAFPILSLLGFVLALIPLPWHLQAWNSGTCLFMFWTALACLNLGVNSIIWHNNAIDWAPVLCDISSRIVVAVAVALPASSLCINRRLYYIASASRVNTSRADKRKAVIVDLAIGLGIPMLQLICQYVVSGHRYDIFEDIGCYPYTYNTPLAYPLSAVWPPAIGVISAVYCILTLRAFLRRRAAFNQYLSSNSSLTTNRYFRLMALASTELLCTIPISSYGLYLNLTAAPMNKWISWSDTHFNYSKIGQFPSALWRVDHTTAVAFELSRWSAVFCAFVFFGFFGFAGEARKNYRLAFQTIIRILGISLLKPKKRLGFIRTEKNILPISTAGTIVSFASPALPPYTGSSDFDYSKSDTKDAKSSQSIHDSASDTDSTTPVGTPIHAKFTQDFPTSPFSASSSSSLHHPEFPSTADSFSDLSPVQETHRSYHAL